MKKTRGFDTWFEVGRANLICHRVLNGLLADLKLSLAQHEVLATISVLDEPTQKELSERLLVVKSNVSALLGKLEARGLVARQTDPSDSRNKRLRLTTAGRDLLDESMQRQNRVVSAMASQLSDDELDELASIMRRASSAVAALEQECAS